MDVKAALLFLAALLTVASSSWQTEGLPEPRLLHAIHPLRPMTGSGGKPANGLNCASWRLAVETDNLRNWLVVPGECEGYVGYYMLGGRYREDSALVAAEAAKYAAGVKLGGDGKDVWVFDIDETALSNLPYYAQKENGFGAQVFNNTSFNEWVLEGVQPALPETLKLYKKVVSLGFKIVFLTGRGEDTRAVTVSNLKKVGYSTWEKLILKSGHTSTALEYKSGERLKLVKQGYRIVGNIGDQWSDILGYPEGMRTFKLPDPMYYIS